MVKLPHPIHKFVDADEVGAFTSGEIRRVFVPAGGVKARETVADLREIERDEDCKYVIVGFILKDFVRLSEILEVDLFLIDIFLKINLLLAPYSFDTKQI